jgi:hypothetical protein
MEIQEYPLQWGNIENCLNQNYQTIKEALISILYQVSVIHI